MPTIDFSADEHAAVTAAVRRIIDETGSRMSLSGDR
jgi:hypothetical protein